LVPVVRRRPPEMSGSTVPLPAELSDPRLWPQCARWDGGTQPCTCWCAKQQTLWLEAGNEWPGGVKRELTDLFDMLDRFPCHQPFDRSDI
jgi:hypothetical protein